MKKNFQRDLRVAIDARGLSIPKFAEMVGVSGKAVWKWLDPTEKGSFPMADKWQPIRQACGLNVQEYVDYGAHVEIGDNTANGNTVSGQIVQGSPAISSDVYNFTKSSKEEIGVEIVMVPKPYAEIVRKAVDKMDILWWAELLKQVNSIDKK